MKSCKVCGPCQAFRSSFDFLLLYKNTTSKVNVLNISFLKEQLLVPSSTIHLLHQQGHASQIHTPSPVRLEQGQAEQVLWTQLTILPGSVEMLACSLTSEPGTSPPNLPQLGQSLHTSIFPSVSNSCKMYMMKD